MAEIKEIIPKRAFELIGEQIGAILTLELSNQSTLDPAFICPTGWRERMVELDSTELPAFNVLFSGNKFSDKSRRSVDADNVYFIDIYTRAAGDDNNRGDVLAMVKQQEIMGKVQAILDNPTYDNLGLLPGTVIRTEIVSMKVLDKGTGADLLSSVVGRISFRVIASEDFEMRSGTLIANATTIVKIGLTEKGFKYQYTTT